MDHKKSVSDRAVVRSLITIALTFFLFFAASALELLTLHSVIRPAANVFLIVLSAAYALHIYNRVVDRRVRTMLTLSACMIVLLAFLRAVKYLALRAPGAPARYVWYLYYLPIIAMPTFLLFAAFYHDLRPGRRLPPAAFLPATVSSVLVIGILFNDLHFLAFSFRPAFENWDADYSRGPLYYIGVIWALLLLFSAVGVFAHKSRLSACKKLTVLPLIPIIAALLLILTFLFDKQPRINDVNVFEFQDILCFFSACFTECCLAIGLIPSNEDYFALFRLSSVSAAVTNDSGNVVYASSRSALRDGELPPEETPVMLDKNTRLYSAPVRGGTVWWQDDLTAINRVNAELAETESRLHEESVLITLQNKLETERAQTREKNRVYDLIAQNVRAQSEKIAALAKKTRQGDGGRETKSGVSQELKRICFYGAYIKRRANMTLLFEDGEPVDGKELIFALDESLRALTDLGLPALRTGSLNVRLTKDAALGVYDAFEELTEQSENTLSGLHAAASGGVLRLTFENARPELSPACEKRLKNAGVACERVFEDENAYYCFRLEGRDKEC